MFLTFGFVSARSQAAALNPGADRQPIQALCVGSIPSLASNSLRRIHYFRRRLKTDPRLSGNAVAWAFSPPDQATSFEIIFLRKKEAVKFHCLSTTAAEHGRIQRDGVNWYLETVQNHSCQSRKRFDASRDR